MADTKLVEGIRIFSPHQNAPDFVLASIVITPNDLHAFLKANPDLMSEYEGKKQVKLQLKKSKAGKLYVEVDTYKAEVKATPAAKAPDEDLPF